MHPILYKSNETLFDTNGIGILADATACTVVEELNGAFEMSMQYPVDGIHYAEIQLRSLIMAKSNPVDDPQPFRVYRITTPLNGVVTVYAQHISYDLSGIPVQPFAAGSAAAAVAALKTNAVVDCPFTFWTDKTTVANMAVTAPASIRSLLGGVRGSILDVYGGQYAFDKYLVRLYARRGADRGVTIRYGKNLTSLEQDANCASVYTAVYPYWQDMEGTQLVQLPEKTVPCPGTYDFKRILTLNFSQEWQEAPTEAQLRARAERYISENSVGTPKINLAIGFVQLEQMEEYKDLALLERVELGDSVTVQFAKLGVDATAKVVRTVYDVLQDRYKTVELGDAKSTLADTIIGQQQAIADQTKAISQIPGLLQGAIDDATAQITGNAGGYVVLHSSTGGQQPDELLIMDTPDITTATKVWRWNKSGLGYSSHGYNGPYGLAMTADGKIVADFITTGTLIASLITSGVLQSNDGKTFYLDLENGVLKMQATDFSISGKTVDQIAEGAAEEAAGSALEEAEAYANTAAAGAQAAAEAYANTAAAGAVAAQTQLDIFNKLTNNGQVQGLYLQDGKVYVNADYMKTGTLNANDVKIINLSAERVSSYSPESSDGKRYQVYIVGGSLYLYRWEGSSYSLIGKLAQYDGFGEISLKDVDSKKTSSLGPNGLYVGRVDGTTRFTGYIYCGGASIQGPATFSFGDPVSSGSVTSYPYGFGIYGDSEDIFLRLTRYDYINNSTYGYDIIKMGSITGDEVEMKCDYLNVNGYSKFKPKNITYKDGNGDTQSIIVLAKE